MAMSYPKNREEPITARLYNYYAFKIFPKISYIRGTYRLKSILEKMGRLGIPKVNEDDIESIGDKKWGNLIILDAARHDTYQEMINQNADSRITAESCSKGFIRENFSEGNWSDTVVVTANPYYSKQEFKKLTGKPPHKVFETVFQLWETDWDEEHGTVMPEKVVETTKTANKLFPDKRKIIHFMQPHHPFLESSINDPGFGDAKQKDVSHEKVWEKTSKGKVKHEDTLEGYKANHRLLKDALQELSKILDKKTMVTADHGNLVGERGFYGPPCRSKLEPLRKVPWDSLENLEL